MLRISESTKFYLSSNCKNDDCEHKCINVRGIEYDYTEVSSDNVKVLKKIFSLTEKVFEDAVKNVGLPTEKIYRVKFYDSDEDFIFGKGSEIIMRNKDCVPVEKLKEGDLCLTIKEITPLDKIGVVKFIVEEEPTEDFYSLDFSKFKNSVNLEHAHSCLGLALSNGVCVKIN